MSNVTRPSSFFERLKAGLEDGIEFARGERQLRTTVVPGAPPVLQAEDVIELRRQLNMSQGILARTLNVSLKTVQSWEQGSRRPSQAALRLLQVLRSRPEAICEVVGIPNQAGSGSGRTPKANQRKDRNGPGRR